MSGGTPEGKRRLRQKFSVDDGAVFTTADLLFYRRDTENMSAVSARLLPPVGPLLGSAYDRGVATLFKARVIVLVILAVQLGVSILTPGSPTTLLGIIWAFYAMANAVRFVFDPDYKMTNRTAGEFFGAQLGIFAIAAALNIFLILGLVRAMNGPLVWLLAVPGFAASMGIYAKLLCAPVLGARGASVSQAFTGSWRSTSGAFLPTLAIPVVNFVVAYVASAVVGMAEYGLLALKIAPAVVNVAGAATLLLLEMYLAQAADLSICMWTKALLAREPVEETVLV